MVGRYGDEVADLVRRFGNDGAELLARHQDDAVEVLSHSIPPTGEWTDFVPAESLKEVKTAFDGDPVAVVLQEDLVVCRYWSDPARQVGKWTTLDPNLSPDEARAVLALPRDNMATNPSHFIIPRGTTVLTGTVASQIYAPWAGAYAIGGGLQVYVPDPSVLLPVIKP